MVETVVTLRPARPGEAAEIRSLVRGAYALYVERMDREPAPMLANYAHLVEQQLVTVVELDGSLTGIVVSYPRGNGAACRKRRRPPGISG